MKKIAIGGGAPITLCAVDNLADGLSWRGNTIAFGDDRSSQTVSDMGGTPQAIVTMTDAFVVQPQLVADGRHVLFTRRPRRRTPRDQNGTGTRRCEIPRCAFATFQEMMWVLPDELRSQVLDLQPEDFDNDRGMWALKVGGTHRLMGNAARAREYGVAAAAVYQPIAGRYPDDAQQQELFGRALALAGRCAEALPAGERALAVRGASVDMANAPYYRYQIARIAIQCGQYDRALDLLEQSVAASGEFTPGWLRIDPSFRPLDGKPRFERLLQRTES